jgi:hypothetical protein
MKPLATCLPASYWRRRMVWTQRAAITAGADRSSRSITTVQTSIGVIARMSKPLVAVKNMSANCPL